MSDTSSTAEVYRDELYCCMDCGCGYFEVAEGPKDRCNQCGSLRDNRRGLADV